jgi:hypothetical protein
MGRTTVFIDDLSKQHQACNAQVIIVKKTIIQVRVLNGQINDCVDTVKREILSNSRRALLTTLLGKDRRELQECIDAFGKGIKAFEVFVKDKSHRWKLESTMRQAKAFLGEMKAAKQQMDDYMVRSKSVVIGFD